MRLAIISTISVLIAGCATTPPTAPEAPATTVNAAPPITDAIDRLMATPTSVPPPIHDCQPAVIDGITIYAGKSHANASAGGLMSGITVFFDLPATASADEVTTKALQTSFGDNFTTHKIRTIRQVEIPNLYFDSDSHRATAAVVDTNIGEKIVLFKYRGPVIGWCCTVYESKTTS